MKGAIRIPVSRPMWDSGKLSQTLNQEGVNGREGIDGSVPLNLSRGRLCGVCQFPWCKFSLHGWSQTTNTLTTESENSGCLTISSNEPICPGSNPSFCLRPVSTIIEAFECFFAVLYDKIFQAYQYFSCCRPVILKPCFTSVRFWEYGQYGAHWFGISSFQTYSMCVVGKVASFPKITYL